MNRGCSHYIDGDCTIGKYQRPSVGTCLLVCDAYDGPDHLRKRFTTTLTIRNRVPCPKCPGSTRAPKEHRFMGFKTQGVPKFVRWWRWAIRSERYDPDEAGCGCFVALLRLKEAASAFRAALRNRREHRSDDRIDRARQNPGDTSRRV